MIGRCFLYAMCRAHLRWSFYAINCSIAPTVSSVFCLFSYLILHKINLLLKPELITYGVASVKSKEPCCERIWGLILFILNYT